MDCFKYLGSQVAADGGCAMDVIHRMNEAHLALGALESVLSNRGLGLRSRSVYINCTNGVVQNRFMGYAKC